MTEPTYHYVKGKGWVPGEYESFTTVGNTGIRVTLVRRIPEDHERYFMVGPKKRNAMQEIVEELSNRHVADMGGPPGYWKRYSKEHQAQYEIVTILVDQ